MSKSRLILSSLITTPIHIGIHSLTSTAKLWCNQSGMFFKKEGLISLIHMLGFTRLSIQVFTLPGTSQLVTISFLMDPQMEEASGRTGLLLVLNKVNAVKWLLNESYGCTTDVLLLWLFIKIPDHFLDQEKYIYNLLICKDKKMYLSP